MQTVNQEITMLGEWLPLDKSYFKILAVVAVLADSNLAFRGKLKDLCEEIGIKPSSVNKDRLKDSLEFLSKNGYVRVIIDHSVYTISLAASAEKSQNVKKIKKAWYQLIRETDSEASWDSNLKMFLYLFELPPDRKLTYKEIGRDINISKSTVGKCVRTICSINFIDFQIYAKKENHQGEEGNIYCMGQRYEQGLNFEK